MKSTCPRQPTCNRSTRGLPFRWRWFGLGACGLLCGCVVWKDDYDVLAAKQRNEAAAHAVAKDELARSRQEVMSLQSKLERIEQRLSDSQRRLDAHEESLAQAEFEYTVVDQQKREATQLVEQLRTELERLAAHFQAYANDREELTVERERLSQELETAESRLQALAVAQERAQQRLEMVRDLSLRLREEIEREEVGLLFDGDVVVLRMDAQRLFGKEKGLTASGKRLLGAVGSALTAEVGADENSDARARKSAAESKSAEATASEPQPRVILNEWEEGERQSMSKTRRELLRGALIGAGVSAERFGSQEVLVDYQTAVRRALEAPAELQPPAVPEIAADRKTRIMVSAALTPVEEWSVPGQSVTLHLVPHIEGENQL